MSQTAKVIDLYDSLLDAKDDRTRAKIIAGAFESLEDRYPELRDMATASGVRQTELRLQKEIEQVRLRIEEVRNELTLEIHQIRADLSREIEQVRTDLTREIEQVRRDLSKEIEQVRTDLAREVGQVRLRIEEVKADLSKQITTGNFKMLVWISGLLFAHLVTVMAVILGTRL